MTKQRVFSIVTAAGLVALSLCGSAEAQNWSPAKPLASSPDGVARPTVAVNASGMIVTAYLQGTQVYARLRKGGSWKKATALSPDTDVADGPAVAAAVNGDALAAWVQGSPGTVVARFFRGGVWSPAATLSSTGFTAASPHVAYDGKHHATMVFFESNPLTFACQTVAVVGTAATGWSAPKIIASDCFNHISLAVNRSGEAAVAWGIYGYTGSPAVVASRSAGGTWSEPVFLAGGGYRQSAPAVGLGDEGTAVVVWQQQPSYFWWSKKLRGTGWLAAQMGPEFNVGGESAIAVDAAGNAMAIMATWDIGGGYPLLGFSLPAATIWTWGEPVQVTPADILVGGFQVAASPAGSFVLGWADTNLYQAGVSTLLPGAANWQQTILGAVDTEVAVGAAAGIGAVLWSDNWTAAVPTISIATAPLP